MHGELQAVCSADYTCNELRFVVEKLSVVYAYNVRISQHVAVMFAKCYKIVGFDVGF